MNKGRIIAIISAAAVAFGFPLVYGRLLGFAVPEWHMFNLFDGAAMGALALALLLASSGSWAGFWRRSRFNRIVLGLFMLAALMEFWRMLRLDHGGYFGSYLYVVGMLALTLLAALRSADFARIIPYLMGWFFITGAWSYFGDYLAGFVAFGIAGNWNWSSVLLIVSAPFIALLLKKRLYKFERFGIFYAGIMVAGTLLALRLCPVFSRGALLSAVAAMVAVGLLTLARRVDWTWSAGVFMALLAAGLAAGYVQYQNFLDFCSTETRPVIYEAAWRIFLDQPVWGCGWGNFGGFAADFKGLDYYLRPLASIWSPHAHNEVLQLLAEGGLEGAVLALAGLLIVVAAAAGYWKRCTAENAVWLFALLTIVGSGMVDMTLEAWPLNYLALIAAGVLWGVWNGDNPGRAEHAVLRKMQLALRFAGTLLFGALTCVIVFSNAYAGYFEREATIHMKRATRLDALESIADFNRAARVRPSRDNLYNPVWMLADGFADYKPDLLLRAAARFEAQFGTSDYRYLRYYKAHARLKLADDRAAGMNLRAAAALRSRALDDLEIHTRRYPMDFRGLALYREGAEKAHSREHAELARSRSNSARMFFPEPAAAFDRAVSGAAAPDVVAVEPDASTVKLYGFFERISGSARTNWGGALLLVLGAWGIGIGIWRAFGVKLENRLLRSAAELAAGFYFLALAMSAAGRWILAHPGWTAGVLGAFAAVALIQVFLLRRRINQYIWDNPLPVLTVCGIVGFYLGSVYLPPLAHDELVYQAALLRSQAESGSVAVRLDIPYSAFPSLGNFNLLYAVSIGGIGAARMAVLTVTAVALLAIGELLRRRCGGALASAMILAYMLGGAAWVMATQVQVECFTLLILAAGAAMVEDGDADSPRTWMIAGALGGMAPAVKLTCGLFAAVFWLLLWTKSRAGLKVRIRFSALLGLSALIAGGIFFIRPYLATGNPVYPYFAGWFGAQETDILVGNIHHLMGSAKYGYSGYGSWFSLIGAGYDALAFDGLAAGYGYLLLVATGAGLTVYGLRRRDFYGTGAYLAGAWILLGFWVLTAPQTRFLAPAVVLLMLAASGWFSRLGSRWRLVAAAAFLAAGILSMPGKIFRNNAYAFFAVRRQVDIPAAYAKISPHTPGMWQALLDSGCRKVMLIYEERGLYLPVDYVVGTPGFQSRFAAYRHGMEAFLRELEDNHIDAVVVGVGTGPDRVAEAQEEYLKMDFVLAEAIRSGRLAIEYQSPDHWLLKVHPAQEKSKKDLQKTEPGVN